MAHMNRHEVNLLASQATVDQALERMERAELGSQEFDMAMAAADAACAARDAALAAYNANGWATYYAGSDSGPVDDSGWCA